MTRGYAAYIDNSAISHFAIVVEMFGLLGFTSRLLVLGLMDRSISSIRRLHGQVESFNVLATQ